MSQQQGAGPPPPPGQQPQLTPAQAKYQEVATKLVQKAKEQCPGKPVREVKFVKVNTPIGIGAGQPIQLTGAIEGQALDIVIPEGAVDGAEFEVPYVVFGPGEFVVGDPFFVAMPEPLPEPEELKPETQSPKKWREDGNAHYKAGRLREAIACYTAGLEATGEGEDAMHLILNNRSMVWSKIGQLDKALADAAVAVQKKPDFAKGHFQKGSICHRAGQMQHALQAFEEAAKYSPGDKKVRAMLAKTKKQVEAQMAGFKAKSRAAAGDGRSGGGGGGGGGGEGRQEQVTKAKGGLYDDKPAPGGGANKYDWGPVPPKGAGATTSTGSGSGAGAGGGMGLYPEQQGPRKMYDWGPIPPLGFTKKSSSDSGDGSGSSSSAAPPAAPPSGKAKLDFRWGQARGGGGADGSSASSSAASSKLKAKSGLTTKAVSMGDGSWLDDADAEAVWVDIEKYSFCDEEGGPQVTVYVELAGVHQLPPGRVTCNFSSSSLMLKVRGLTWTNSSTGVTEPTNMRLWCEELWGQIDTSKCKISVKPNQVIVHLHKAMGSDRPWDRLQFGRGGAFF